MMMIHQPPPGFGWGPARQSEHPAPAPGHLHVRGTPGGSCGTGSPKATTLVVQCAHGIRV